MGFHFQEEYLDLVLVPCGILIMFVYHLFLLYRYLFCPPDATSMGFENNDRSEWVHRIMKASPSSPSSSIPIASLQPSVPVSSVENAVLRGTEFWSLGLRALYFALNLLMWFFGPIPMFASSIVIVLVLHWMDYNSKTLHPTMFKERNLKKPRSQILKGNV